MRDATATDTNPAQVIATAKTWQEIALHIASPFIFRPPASNGASPGNRCPDLCGGASRRGVDAIVGASDGKALSGVENLASVRVKVIPCRPLRLLDADERCSHD